MKNLLKEEVRPARLELEHLVVESEDLPLVEDVEVNPHAVSEPGATSFFHNRVPQPGLILVLGQYRAGGFENFHTVNLIALIDEKK